MSGTMVPPGRDVEQLNSSADSEDRNISIVRGPDRGECIVVGTKIDTVTRGIGSCHAVAGAVDVTASEYQ